MAECTANAASAKARIPIVAGVDSFRACWVSDQLYAMHEPRLTDTRLAPGDTILRFTELPSFTHGFAIRIESVGRRTTMFSTEIGGAGGYQPGDVIAYRRGKLSGSKWAEIQSVIVASRLAAKATIPEHQMATLDGTEWILEVRTADRYQLVLRSAPDSDVIQIAETLRRIADMPNYGSVRGRLTDAGTGAPIVGAGAMFIPFSFFRENVTDARGYFSLDSIPIGEGSIRFECPRQNGALNANLPDEPITVRRGKTTVVNIRTVPHACDMPAFAVQHLVISGFASGDSANYFAPDRDSSTATILWGGFPRWRHAVVRYDSTKFPNRLGAWSSARDDYPCWRVTWRGTLSGPRGYEFANYEFVLDSILIVRPARPGECRS